MESSVFYTKYRTLIQQWKYEELQSFVNGILPSNSEYWIGQYALFESYLARADFAAAEECFYHAEKHLPSSHTLFTSFSLRYQFLLLQTYQLEDLFAAHQYFETVYDQPDTSNYNRALALAQYGRSMLLAMSFGLLPATEKQTALRFLTNATALFRDNGFIQDYHSTLQLQAETNQKKPNAKPSEAERLFRQLLDSAELHNDKISGGQAKLALAELAFEKQYKPDITEKDLQLLTDSFAEALERMKNGEHLVGGAVVDSRLGELLLRFGIKEGLTCLEEAYTAFEANHFPAQAQSMLRAIGSWHLNHGNAKENIEYEQRASELDSSIHISLGNKVSYLVRIEQAHRTGDIGAARLLYSEASEDFSEHPLRAQLDFLHANNLLKAGLHDESLAIFRNVVERMEKPEASSFLSDAYTNLSTSLIHTNAWEAAKYIAKAIEIDEVLGDSLTKVKHIQIFIQILVEQTKIEHGAFLQIPPSIDVCFEECRKLLRDNYTLDALTRHGELFQARGYLFFLAKRYNEALLAYQQAESILSPLQVNNHLSFLASHQGITLIEKARQTSSTDFYDEAKIYLQKSLELFELGLQKAEQARVLGLLGICDYEAGRLEKPDKAALRWVQAEVSFEAAYQLHRYLRIHADHSSSFSRQRSMIAYGRQNLTYPTQAFFMHYGYTKQSRLAIKWLERTKSQALIEAMLTRNNLKGADEWLTENNLINEQDAFSDIVQKVQEALPDTPCLVIQYFCLSTHVLVYGIRKEWEEPKMITLPISYTGLNDCAELYFSSQYGSVRSMMEHDLEKQWQLFRRLVQPVEDWSLPGDIVYLIPHAILHRFPLHTLQVSDGQYLIERNPVSYSLSLSVFSLQQTRKSLYSAELNQKAEVFGDSRNNLPFARLEANTVARLFGVEPHLDTAVTKEAVMDSLSRYNTVHICCHGELSGQDGWQHGMQMALKQTLTAGDIFPVQTAADLVVLSGCETGVSEYIEGDELTGLIRAFVHAGISNLVVSQWKVDDEATADLFTAFYTCLRHTPYVSKIVALQQAMCQIRSTGRHMYYWGAFQIFGQLN